MTNKFNGGGNPSKVKIYNSFDGLRALAALGIAMMHYKAFIVVKPSENFLTSNCIPFFTEFVFLFFMVSSFGLCCGYFRSFKTVNIDNVVYSRFDTNKFYSKRFYRIWPYFALLVFIDVTMYIATNGAAWTEGLKDELFQAFADLTMCFNLLPNPDIQVIGGGWFLGTIFVFYIMFPFFVFLLSRKSRAWFALFVSLMVHLMTVHYFLTPQFCLDSQIQNARHEITYSFIFLMCGGILFLYRNQIEKIEKSTLKKLLLLSLILVATLLQVCFHPTILGENRLYQLLLFSLWIIYAISGGLSFRGNKFLDNKLMNFLGGISMEIYLTHMMMFRLIEKCNLRNFITDRDLLFVVTYILGISLSVGFACAVKYKIFPFVEQIFSKYSQK